MNHNTYSVWKIIIELFKQSIGNEIRSAFCCYFQQVLSALLDENKSEPSFFGQELFTCSVNVDTFKFQINKLNY